ncbi:MAG TPA: class I SAM-dependent methyltransferase, partial [bacterium]|nr:class I SAM-dependent methyltransferase [bacterium]
AVSQCEMDHDALLLKMGKVERIFGQAPIELVEKKFILFTPFRAGFFRWLEGVLGWLPLGAQYYVAAKR